MKYDSLKRTFSKTFRVSKFDGGINTALEPSNIENNQLSDGKNVWVKNGRLQTRPGIVCSENHAIKTHIPGAFGRLDYEIHNAGIYIEGEYMRIASAQVCTDDYEYDCNVFLIGEGGGYIPIGKMTFLRTTSEIFYTPINILFYTGKAQNGGGIFAMVTLQNGYDDTDRYYNFYEINADFTEWNKIYNFYIPTLYINGRGNKYELAKENGAVYSASPKILESPNMLNGRFHSYFTSDGYSNSFRLPFANLSVDTVVCRIYYTLVDYAEWQVGSQSIENKQTFFGKEVTMEVDREKGTVYFVSDGADYAIPAMDMYHENNIKITATKEIENGTQRIIHSSCACVYESRIIISGGERGNEVFVADYNSPLYFPQNSSIKVGLGDSEINDFKIKDGKIIAFKKSEIYALTLKTGDRINDISLLADNDKFFTANDSFSCRLITNQAGSCDRKLAANINDYIVFMGPDGRAYMLTSLDANGIVCISDCLGEQFNDFKYADFSFVGGNKYLIFKNNKAFVAEIISQNKVIWHYWEFPDNFKISGGFGANKLLYLLCVSGESRLSYIASLNGCKDSYLESDEEIITKTELPVKSYITTKHFDLSQYSARKSIESIYLSLASKGTIGISVNGKQIADVNFRLTNEEYDKCEYKSVKLMPYINGINSVYITLCSENGMSIGEIEINYRKQG